jgi:glutathione S-transferase
VTEPLELFGLDVSYFTGKMEGYLRYKEIPYRKVSATPAIWRQMQRETGAAQVPAIRLADGRWMTDTTPMIDWFERGHPEPAVVPPDPLQGFFARLVEDYADEWMWRPAMHYRWSHRGDALLLSRLITDELGRDLRLPGFLQRMAMRRRQLGRFVRGDGVTPETRAHVESVYLRTLDQLEAVFASRPYLFGERPTLADLGFFGSMFRHFGHDPTAAELMRRRAPGVYEWLARLWNARASTTRGVLVSGVPDDLGPILDEVGSAYLPYLCANAEAWRAGSQRHDAMIQGVRYRALPISQYRVWCLERLQAHFEALPDAVQPEARKRLEAHGCWEPLFRLSPESGYDREGRVPFRGRKVHYDRPD